MMTGFDSVLEALAQDDDVEVEVAFIQTHLVDGDVERACDIVEDNGGIVYSANEFRDGTEIIFNMDSNS